jgi:hypothetical protein
MSTKYGRKSNRAFRVAIQESWEKEDRLTLPLSRMGYRVLTPDRILRTDDQANNNPIKTNQSDYGDLLVYHHEVGTKIWDVKELGGAACWFNNPKFVEDNWERGTLLERLSEHMELLPVTKKYQVKNLWKKENTTYCLVPWISKDDKKERNKTELYQYCILVPESTKSQWVSGWYEEPDGRGDDFWMVSIHHPDLKVLDFRYDIVDSDVPVPNRNWTDLLGVMLNDLTAQDSTTTYPDY